MFTELFKLLGIIAIDNKEANEAIDDTTDRGAKAEGKLSKAFKGIGKGALAVGKAVGVGMVAAGTAVSALVTQSTSSYAEYEQLVGGVDTLFKESASKVLEYANNAYKTAGMSANEYMTTVTSFSASLLQSLGGDTEAAADKADMAIRDMSDNANKMGTTMDMIQNAYNGFAKQNYTMLDNLKLGYGGTKEEMQRLLKDAEKLSGQKFDISSYGDVVDAIHVIQTEMGITGTTAAEAAGTISGSSASVGAAWKNLVTAMADENADLGAYVDTFVNSLSTAAENMIPRIGIALEGVVSLVDKLAPVIVEKLPGLLGQLLPSIVTAATGLVQSLTAALPGLIDMLVNDLLPQLVTSLVTITNSLISALPGLMQSICSALPTLIPLLVNGAVSMILTLCQNLPLIIQPIIDNLPSIIQSIVDALLGDNLSLLIQGLIDMTTQLLLCLPQIMTLILDSLPVIISGVVDGLISSVPVLLAGLKTMAEQLIPTMISYYTSLPGKFSNIFRSVWEGIKKIFSNLGGWFSEKFSDAKNRVVSAFSGVKEKISAPFEKARDAIKKVVDKIKGFFTGMKLEFPKIKAPHFVITPKGWKIGDLLEGKIPKLGIDWYAKAMDEPMIMNRPTIFGYNGATGELMGGGEAGSEVVSGTNTLMQMIQGAVAAQNETLAYYLESIVNILAEYCPQALEHMEHPVPAVIGVNQAADALASPINYRLGRMAMMKGRG